MNKKSKIEQIFILLTAFTVCFLLFATIGFVSGCSITPLDNDNSLYTCGGNGCIGCGNTCGTVDGNPYWDCSKGTGCIKYYTGFIDEGDDCSVASGMSCGECTGCLISNSSCGLYCGGCEIGNADFNRR